MGEKYTGKKDGWKDVESVKVKVEIQQEIQHSKGTLYVKLFFLTNYQDLINTQQCLKWGLRKDTSVLGDN